MKSLKRKFKSQFIRLIKIIKYRLLWGLTAFAILFVSCNGDEIIQNLNQNKVNETYSDKDVFKGVIFLEGSVSHKLPDFKELSFESYEKNIFKIKKMLIFENEIMENIKTKNPNYFKNFRNKISSGDFYAVKQALSEASEKVYKEILVLSKSNKEDTNKVAVAIVNNFSKHKNEYSQKKQFHTTTFDKKKMDGLQRVSVKKDLYNEMNASSVYYDTDSFVYMEFAAVVAGFVMIFIVLEEHRGNKAVFDEYTKGEYLAKVVFNLKGI